MLRACFLMIITVLIMLSCKSADVNPNPKQELLVKNAIEKQEFRIESDFAYPQVSNAFQQVANSGLLQPNSTASAISLIGNSNFLEIRSDSIRSYLPYYGELQIVMNRNSSAIEFNDVFKDYKLGKDKKGNTTITLFTSSHSEGFKVNITIYPNAKTRMFVFGNGRLPISYSGRLTDLD